MTSCRQILFVIILVSNKSDPSLFCFKSYHSYDDRLNWTAEQRVDIPGVGGTPYIKKVGMLVENFEIDP